MWSYLTTRYFISTLADYVENKVALPKVLRLDKIAFVLARFDHSAGLLRATHTACRVASLAAVDGLGNASRPGGNLCVVNSRTAIVTKAIALFRGTGLCA
jgi:hypothetical protein